MSKTIVNLSEIEKRTTAALISHGAEEWVAKEVAKADIKSEIKRKAFPRGGKKPSDFYNKPKGR